MEEFGLVRDFAIIMSVAGVALVLFRRLGLPPILGYILAGVVIGPYTLPNPPVKDPELIRLLADLGLLLLLFGLGLEFGWQRIRQAGMRVVLIGLIEISVMIALGYELGLLLGWTGKEALFLGGAMAISSSAVVIKVLYDTGKLHTVAGRLIVGVLVIEDFAAVVLLSVLSGVASTGTADVGDVGALVGKLAIFAVAALVIGGLIAQRLIHYVAQFRSKEILLVSGLAMCFGMAVIGVELEVSAAAGAFLIGAVLGDSEQAEQLRETMSPIRDMFAALFFVSIGMLVDPGELGEYIGPALAVSAVFVIGKIVAASVATFLVSQDERTSLNVGMGMSQIGEFSLAMAKVGVDRGAVGAFLYPVITVSTAVTAMAYPFIFRSADRTAQRLHRLAPRVLRRYLDNLSELLRGLRTVVNLRGDLGFRVRHSGMIILVNLAIVVIVVLGGMVALRLSEDIADTLNMPERTLGLIVAAAVLAVSGIAALLIWRALRQIGDDVFRFMLRARKNRWSLLRIKHARIILRDSLAIFVMLLLISWTLPIFFRLFELGGLSVPLVAAVGGIAVLLAVLAGVRIHAIIEGSLARTFSSKAERSKTHIADPTDGETSQPAGDPR